MRRSRVPAVVLFSLFAAGCSGADDPDPGGSSSPPTGSADAPSAALVAGSGADISPEDPEAWCGAITAEQLTEATDVEFTSVDVLGSKCSADSADFSLQLTWRTEPTTLTPEQYEAGWRKPADVYDVLPLVLESGAAGASKTGESPVHATVGVVDEGSLIETSLFAMVPGDEALTSAELVEIGKLVVAVYAG